MLRDKRRMYVMQHVRPHLADVCGCQTEQEKHVSIDILLRKRFRATADASLCFVRLWGAEYLTVGMRT